MQAGAGLPQLLGCSVECNSKPTEQCLRELGLTDTQVAKAVAGFPRLLGYSVEDNLKPTVQWLRELGLSDAQVVKTVAGYPPLIGRSVEDNMKRKVALLRQLFAGDEIILMITRFPQLVGYSCERIEARIALLRSRDCLDAFPSALALTEEVFTTRFGA